jgi:hypothetical protein
MLKQHSEVTAVPTGPEPVDPEPSAPARDAVMLSPAAAWRALCARTGCCIAKVTFYRWLRNGRVYSIRLGQRIFIPQPALDELITKCLDGERY